jgi:hypothetical protein
MALPAERMQAMRERRSVRGLRELRLQTNRDAPPAGIPGYDLHAPAND